MIKINLATQSGDKLNGSTWTDDGAMLEAVRAEYGEDCHFSVADGFIVNGKYECVATYGRE